MNQAVFSHFKAMQYSSSHACAEMTVVALAEVTDAMREMIRLGNLKPVEGCEGLYKYCTANPGGYRQAPKAAPPVPEVQKKLWWAACMPFNSPSPFTIFTIAQVAGVSYEYAARYIRKMVAKKAVKRIGRLGREARYRVTSTAPTAYNPIRVNIQLGG